MPAFSINRISDVLILGPVIGIITKNFEYVRILFETETSL